MIHTLPWTNVCLLAAPSCGALLCFCIYGIHASFGLQHRYIECAMPCLGGFGRLPVTPKLTCLLACAMPSQTQFDKSKTPMSTILHLLHPHHNPSPSLALTASSPTALAFCLAHPPSRPVLSATARDNRDRGWHGHACMHAYKHHLRQPLRPIAPDAAFGISRGDQLTTDVNGA
ncbi:unnamed protein product [Periconia digitata]|uniref:Uncharacterized protein n=1 Tax=Periconia digitata TaxID=1303443 RepID=A0A9W4U6W6_9PLEO|nr:unnamed protein product [Periconia digitata]